MRTPWQAITASPLTRAVGIPVLTAATGLLQAVLTGAWPDPDGWIAIAQTLSGLWPAAHDTGCRDACPPPDEPAQRVREAASPYPRR
ncbi:hypothetical protein AB0M43_28610 [Longispora sp. NPDC051575]|uniref:hypothetical protein n=1 Tax=Longispora sp. NPDC051575 TaxID=3154943 RepID=UPI00341471D9